MSDAAIRVFGKDVRQYKQFWDGTQRACDPHETVARLRPLASRFGITRVANVTGLDTIGIPVWVAIRPNARGLAVAQGKGLTDAASQASAMMESIECWHAEHITQPVIIESAWALRQRAAVADIDGLPAYADNLPRPDQPLPWIEGYDVLRQQPCWVPLETVSTNYVTAGPYHLPHFVQSSNGLAGGNALLEALTHALAELIERDAIHHAGTAWTGLDGRRRVRLDTIRDHACRQVLDCFEQAGVQAAVFDLTSDLGIPVYACSVLDADAGVRLRTLPPFSGYGCHLSPAVALLRALTEAAQSRLTYISGSRDDIAWSEYRRGGNADALASYRTALAQSTPTLDFSQRANAATDSFHADVALLLDRLRLAGITSAVVVNLEQAEFGIPVVKAVVPGLAGALIAGHAIRTPQRRFLTDKAVP